METPFGSSVTMGWEGADWGRHTSNSHEKRKGCGL
jgi:hypothetical protein